MISTPFAQLVTALAAVWQVFEEFKKEPSAHWAWQSAPLLRILKPALQVVQTEPSVVEHERQLETRHLMLQAALVEESS